MNSFSLVFVAFVALGAIEEVVGSTDPAASLPPSEAINIDAELGGFDGFDDIDDIDSIDIATDLRVKPCRINSPERNECFKTLFNQMLPKLKDGVPALNINSVDPYFYKRGIFRYTTAGIDGGMIIKNMLINGIANVRVNNVLTNFTDGKRFVAKLSGTLSQLKAGGYFKADVKIGGIRLVPKGLFNITVDDARSNVITEGHIENVSPRGQRLKLDRLNANIAFVNARIMTSGIFSDKELNTMILDIINQNLPEIIRIGMPATRDQWAPIVVEHVNNFFAKIPLEKFLSD